MGTSVVNGWAMQVAWRLDPSTAGCHYAWVGELVPPETLTLAPGQPRSGGVLQCSDGPRVVVLEPGVPVDVRDCWPQTRGDQACAVVGGRPTCELVAVTLTPAAPPAEVGCWGEPSWTFQPGQTLYVPVGEGCALQLGSATGSVDLGPVEPGDAVDCVVAAEGVSCRVEPWAP